MTDEQDKAKLFIDRASRVMSYLEMDLCQRVLDGETHLLGEWTSKEDRREFAGLETNYAEYLK